MRPEFKCSGRNELDIADLHGQNRHILQDWSARNEVRSNARDENLRNATTRM